MDRPPAQHEAKKNANTRKSAGIAIARTEAEAEEKLSPHDRHVLALQQTAGNRAVGRLLRKSVGQSGADRNDTGLPDELKSGIESLSGMSLDQVRVHYNSSQPAQLDALAYTQGTDIHVAPGQEQHLPHEAWHVVQQAQGRVQPTAQLRDGVPLNDDPTLEQEADSMGATAAAAAPAQHGGAFREGSKPR